MIKDIYLRNFKCFEELHLELSNLNVLAGINSMGKSTVIQSILLLRQAYETNSINTGLPLNGELIKIGLGYDILFRDSDQDYFTIGFSSCNESLEWNYKYDKESNFQKLINNDIRQTNIDQCNIFSPDFSYIGADRIGPKSFYEKSHYHVFNSRQLGYQGEFYADYLAEKGFNERIENNNVLHANVDSAILIYQFQAWISEISPGMTVVPRKYIEAGIVSIGYNVDNKEYTPLNIGFGISYTAPIILSLLKAKEGDLVILENPEAHLHPRGQRIMGELIARACAGGVQVIVETHSDHLLNGIRLSVKNGNIDRSLIRLNYFYQELRKNEITLETKVIHKKCSPSVLKDGSLSDWPDGFFDEWDKAIDDLF